VRYSAESWGFHGEVREQFVQHNPDSVVRQQAESNLINNPALSKEQARQAVDAFMISSVKGAYDSQNLVLNQLVQSGARNTALNLSLGVSPASLTEDHRFALSGD